jgi:hypothetical protein
MTSIKHPLTAELKAEITATVVAFNNNLPKKFSYIH